MCECILSPEQVKRFDDFMTTVPNLIALLEKVNSNTINIDNITVNAENVSTEEFIKEIAKNINKGR